MTKTALVSVEKPTIVNVQDVCSQQRVRLGILRRVNSDGFRDVQFVVQRVEHVVRQDGKYIVCLGNGKQMEYAKNDQITLMPNDRTTLEYWNPENSSVDHPYSTRKHR